MLTTAAVEALDEIKERLRDDPSGALFETIVLAALGRLFDDVPPVAQGPNGRLCLAARRGDGGSVLVGIRSGPAPEAEVLALAREAGERGCQVMLVTWPTGGAPEWDREEVARQALRELGVVFDVTTSAGSLAAKVSMFGLAALEETLEWVQAEVSRVLVAPRSPVQEGR